MDDDSVWTVTVLDDSLVEEIYFLEEAINLCQPCGAKVLSIIPTLEGFILKTKPFNTTELAITLNKMPDISKYKQV